MKLSGFSHPQSRTRGGIRKIALIAAEELSHIMVNARSEYQVFSKNGWTEFDCREDSCSYTETTDTTDSTPKTVHTLTFDITGMGRDAQEALRRLLTCHSGVLAVITTHDSGMMLVGYSDLLTTEYPLRVNRL